MPAGPYSYTLIDPPYDIDTGAYRTVTATQVNDAGEVLGTLSGSTPTQPFLYADGAYTVLAAPGAASTTATQLNNAGQVIGRYTDAAGTHSFVYQNGAFAEVAAPGGAFTDVLQISPGGLILADYFDSAGLHPAIDDNGRFTTLAVPGATSTVVRTGTSGPGLLPVINDAGEAIGSYTDAAGSHAFLYDGNGGYATLAVPGGFNTVATGINAAGQVIGTYATGPGTASGTARSFVYSDGTYATVAVPGATSTSAAQINDAGQIAGSYSDAAGAHVFLDTDGNFITVNPPSGASSPVFLTQLNNAGDVLAIGPGSNSPGVANLPFVYSGGVSTDVDVPGAATTSSLRFNDAGQLIGSVFDGVASHAFLATPGLATPAGNGAGQAGPGDATADAGAAAALLLPVEDGGAASVPPIGTTDPGLLLA